MKEKREKNGSLTEIYEKKEKFFDRERK